MSEHKQQFKVGDLVKFVSANDPEKIYIIIHIDKRYMSVWNTYITMYTLWNVTSGKRYKSCSEDEFEKVSLD